VNRTLIRNFQKALAIIDAEIAFERDHALDAVEHFNEEAGRVWMERVVATYPACIWLNPVPQSEWETTASIRLMRQLFAGRMYPLTIEGLDAAMRELGR